MLLLFKNWATLMLTAKYVVKRNDLKIKNLKCRAVVCGVFCKEKLTMLNDKSKLKCVNFSCLHDVYFIFICSK